MIVRIFKSNKDIHTIQQHDKFVFVSTALFSDTFYLNWIAYRSASCVSRSSRKLG